ncbi:hypothetical protein BGZ75_003055 [Mortierella antarctica]|nr:hypothetical protein BGZ75_003055 [Mortierella antarctica]
MEAKSSSRSSSSKSSSQLGDPTLGLQNLQLGSSGSSTKAGKEGSKGSKGSKKSKKSAPPAQKLSPILLGMPDSPMAAQDDVDPYVTKIGGLPLWLEENRPAPSKYGVCEACGKDMYLLLQAYVPLEKSSYDRVVYVWACNQRLCMRKKGSFRVVRALKLNAEYAQKLEKKSKPAVVPAAKPAIATPAANPFAAPGAFDMGNALFGGAGGGFNNPFASSSTSANPFAPPPGFGAGSQTSTAKSFADVTSPSLPKEDEPASESGDEEEAVEEETSWPDHPPAFSPHYLYITEEVLEDSSSVDDEISQRYSHFLALEEGVNNNSDDDEPQGGATWSGEAYEKASLPKGVDKAFKKFTERVQAWPDQCVRYDFPGIPLLFSFSDPTARMLLPPNAIQHTKHTTPSAHRIPKCPACKGPRGFEFQLMPNLLSLLDVTSKKYLSEDEKKSLRERKGAQVFDIGMEWGTILVYSCIEDCFGKAAARKEGDESSTTSVKYFEEVALVQFED